MSDEEVTGCKKGCEQRETIVNGEEYVEPVPLTINHKDRCKWFRSNYDSCKDCPYVEVNKDE